MQDTWFHRWARKIPWGRNGSPLQCSCLGSPIGRGGWRVPSPWGHQLNYSSRSEMNVSPCSHPNLKSRIEDKDPSHFVKHSFTKSNNSFSRDTLRISPRLLWAGKKLWNSNGRKLSSSAWSLEYTVDLFFPVFIVFPFRISPFCLIPLFFF